MLGGWHHVIAICVHSSNLHSLLYHHTSGLDLISALKYFDVRFLRVAQWDSLEVGPSTKRTQV